MRLHLVQSYCYPAIFGVTFMFHILSNRVREAFVSISFCFVVLIFYVVPDDSNVIYLRRKIYI